MSFRQGLGQGIGAGVGLGVVAIGSVAAVGVIGLILMMKAASAPVSMPAREGLQSSYVTIRTERTNIGW